MPKVGMAAIRRPQLIDAAMEAINQVGLHKASVAMISDLAGMSPAIINHHFGGKDYLLEATMRSVLRKLSESVMTELSKTHPDDVVGRIKAIVKGNFDPHQTDAKVVKTWLAFWSESMHHPALFRLQRVNEKRLFSHLKLELKRILPAPQAHRVAQMLAALIDGIWLRGALSQRGINSEQAQQLIHACLERQLPAEVLVNPNRYRPEARTKNKVKT
ncbi:transcriptional regulator BetI [Gynuella sp.]|uniref:transcriptional regulator BetI n=1 Tax=Gynuella sp. TaxID=2969146 RepID=UPI003D1400BD